MGSTAFFRKIKETILPDLRLAKKEIKIAVAWFTNHDFFDVLLVKLSQGVKVSLIVVNDPINNREGGLDWQKFINAGGVLHFSYYPNIMHHKFCIIDNKLIYNGSYNWTYYAEYVNSENVLRINLNTRLVNEFNNEFKLLLGRYKQCKKVRRYKLDDLLNFQLDKVLAPFIAKELEVNSKWLIKCKNFSLAEKVIATALVVCPNRHTKKLVPIKENIKRLKDQNAVRELVGFAVDKELEVIGRMKNRLELKKLTGPTNQVKDNSHSINTNHLDKVLELNKKEQLLKSLKRDKIQGSVGELRINLKWSTYDDLDLHVFDPAKNHIYYSSKEAIAKGSKGQLDIDANAGNDRSLSPQENIFWESNPPSGKYKIIVNHYSIKQDNIVPFIVSIVSPLCKPKIIYANVDYQNFQSMLVAEIKFIRGKGITEIVERKVPFKFN